MRYRVLTTIITKEGNASGYYEIEAPTKRRAKMEALSKARKDLQEEKQYSGAQFSDNCLRIEIGEIEKMFTSKYEWITNNG